MNESERTELNVPTVETESERTKHLSKSLSATVDRFIINYANHSKLCILKRSTTSENICICGFHGIVMTIQEKFKKLNSTN